jgi:CRISP-associated protein Cas1
MSQWRGILLTESASLSVKHGQIYIAQKSGDILSFPPSDIGYIVCDTQYYTISGALLALIADNGICFITTDAKHIPNAILLPFGTHFKTAGNGRLQIAISQGLKDKLWAKIIKAKIRGQAHIMKNHNLPNDILLDYASNVVSGDPDNYEARAARHYWENIMPPSRNADGDDIFNIMLNYGYAIIRSVISKYLTASGLMPAFGIHHNSATNSFNLSDDIIEAYRPLVDGYIFDYITDKGMDTPFDKHAKAYCVKVLEQKLMLEDKHYNLLMAIDITCQSLLRCYKADRIKDLLIPTWIIED